MVVFVATVTVQSDKLEEAKKIAQNAAKACEAEPGTLLYWIGNGQTDPTTFVFYEVYRDEEAQRKHRETWARFSKDWMPLVESYQFYTEVGSIEPKGQA